MDIKSFISLIIIITVGFIFFCLNQYKMDKAQSEAIELVNRNINLLSQDVNNLIAGQTAIANIVSEISEGCR